MAGLEPKHLKLMLGLVAMKDLDGLMQHFGDDETVDILLMHKYFDIPYSVMVNKPNAGDLYGRCQFLEEEVLELHEAIATDDFLKIIDALVDIVVVAKGTAVMMGIPWGRHWHEVLRANMDKIRTQGNRYDTVPELSKPPGWRPPNHQQVLDDAK